MSLPRAFALLALILLAPLRAGAEAETAPAAEGLRGFGVEQARLMGMAALEAGRPDVAVEIARALLTRDDTDAYAHFLMATALMRAGDLEGAQAAARRAHRHAQSPQQRYQSARLTAVAAWNREHYGRAQWWLRRAADAAPGAAERELSIRALRNVRARNPWQIDLQFSVNPSNNVNNGASGEYNIIDGVPIVGWLSPDGQALSGLITEARGQAAYRIRRGAGSETHVTGGLTLRRVDLSRASRDRVPDLDPRIYDTHRAEIGLRHTIRPADSPQVIAAEIGAGRQWARDGRDYSFARASVGWHRALGGHTLAGLTAAVEAREATPGQTRGDSVHSVQASLVRLRDNGDVIGGGLWFSGHDTQFAGRSSQGVGGYLSYELGREIGPAKLSGMLTVSRTGFSGYVVGPIAVPGGRRDDTYGAVLNVTFPGVSYAGFAPVVTLRTVRTRSNVSRFDTSQTGVSVGLRSQF